ncbi:MAG: 2-phospho-L-lactate guanylyltransferase [Myxococcales bacterium]|nr:2-phospho-L-lactate guanylyltransferase [Myxococcales bacterium]
MRPHTAIVPVKGFAHAKSRLTETLTTSEREAFARHCFEHVLGLLEHHPGVDRVLVSSRDADVLALARTRGHVPLHDPVSASRLNEVIDAALTVAVEQGAEAALVLMCDLPLLRACDLDALFASDAELVLAPDGARAGTNALVVAPADLLPTCFGDARSFALHTARAKALGARTHVVHSEGLAGDVDTPADYAAYRARLSPPARG